MTQFNAPTYDIERPTGQCAFTGRTLTPGEHYMATLVEVDPAADAASSDSSGNDIAATAGKLGFKRVDVSSKAWEQGHRPPGMFGYWRATVPEPNQKRKLFVDDDVLLNLFRRLADAEDDPQRQAFRFVLGLILMRKKMLRYDGTRKETATGADGQPVQRDHWLLTPKLDVSKGPLGKWNDDDSLEMLDPHMAEEQIQQVIEQLGQILQAEL